MTTVEREIARSTRLFLLCGGRGEVILTNNITFRILPGRSWLLSPLKSAPSAAKQTNAIIYVLNIHPSIFYNSSSLISLHHRGVGQMAVYVGRRFFQGFVKSASMTIVSEIGDKTFFVAALMAMRHPRKVVLAGCLGALVVMTIISAIFGWATPNLLSRKWTHYATTTLFFVFGAHSLWEGIMEDEKESELSEVEAKLDGQLKSENGPSAEKQAKTNSEDHDLKKQKRRSMAVRYFSPVFLEAFSLTFLGEWGDRSQIATVGLAAVENVIAVTLGGILGQSLCTCAAVWGGKHLASKISEKVVAICGGILFIIFGIHSFFSGDIEIV